MSSSPPVIAVDFDGVLHDPLNIKAGYKLGQPIAGAVEAMNRLKAQGAIIVVHTIWGDTNQKRLAISQWCRYFNIPYDFITNIKPKAMIYIDDKGYRFRNWNDTLDFIASLPAQGS